MVVSISINRFQSTKMMQSVHVDHPNKRETVHCSKILHIGAYLFCEQISSFPTYLQKLCTNMVAHTKMKMIGGAKSHSLNSTSFG